MDEKLPSKKNPQLKQKIVYSHNRYACFDNKNFLSNQYITRYTNKIQDERKR